MSAAPPDGAFSPSALQGSAVAPIDEAPPEVHGAARNNATLQQAQEASTYMVPPTARPDRVEPYETMSVLQTKRTVQGLFAHEVSNTKSVRVDENVSRQHPNSTSFLANVRKVVPPSPRAHGLLRRELICAYVTDWSDISTA